MIGYARINTIGDSLRLITGEVPIYSDAIHQRTYVDEFTFSTERTYACLKPLTLLG